MIKHTSSLFDLGTANIQAVLASSTIAARGAQAWSHEWMGIARRAVEATTFATKALVACRTPAEVIALQKLVAQEAVSGVLAERNRMAELASGIVRSTLAPLGTQAKSTMTLALLGRQPT